MIEEYIPKFMDILYENDIKQLITLDEIRDAFHTNQIVSKNDAIIGFSKLTKTPSKKVLYIGSWLGLLTRYLCEKYPNYTFDEIDYDNHLRQLNQKYCENIKNYGIYHNIPFADLKTLNQYTTIINLSTEHSDNTWFDLLKQGTEVVMQTNNFNIDGHINLCQSIEEMKIKYPLTEIYYQNTIELNVYTRFTLVGKK